LLLIVLSQNKLLFLPVVANIKTKTTKTTDHIVELFLNFIRLTVLAQFFEFFSRARTSSNVRLNNRFRHQTYNAHPF